MRRHAYGCIASGAVLFAGSALGVIGTWATITAVVLLTVGAFTLAIAMEADSSPTRSTAPVPRRAPVPGPDLAA